MKTSTASADYWTYVEVAALFDLPVDSLRRKMATFEKAGFPAPLPWSSRPLRWNPAAVRAWKERREIASQSVPPVLRLIRGGA